MSKSCTVMDLPQPATITNYNCHVKKLSIIAAEQCEQNMLGAEKHLKSFLKRNEDDMVDVPVTVDGTWQKRYGHISTLGVTFVISADTGEVLHYEVKSSYFKKCQYSTGDHECSKNHQGSSASMEKISVAEMFRRSIEKQNLRYTMYIGDGDTNSFAAEVREKLKEKFGDGSSVTKEDYIGYIQKRMGAALRTYKSKNRGQKLSDGKTIGGKGRLTYDIVDSIQNYYVQAVRSDVGNLKATQGPVWAIYYYIINSPSEESLETHHSFCPARPNSWCKFQLGKVIVAIFIIKRIVYHLLFILN